MKTPNLTDEEELTEQPILELTATTQLSDYVSAIAWSPTGNTFAAACRPLASGCGGSAGTRWGRGGILLFSLASHWLSVSSRGTAG